MPNERFTDAHYDKLAQLEMERGRIQAAGFMAELSDQGLVTKTAGDDKTIGRAAQAVAAVAPSMGSRLRAGASRLGMAAASGGSAAVHNAAGFVGKNKALTGIAAAGVGLAGVGAYRAGKGRRAEGAALGPAGVAVKDRITKSAAAYDAHQAAIDATKSAVGKSGFARASARVGFGLATAAGNTAAHVGANKKIYGGLGLATAAGIGAAAYDRHTGGRGAAALSSATSTAKGHMTQAYSSGRAAAGAGAAKAREHFNTGVGAVKMRLNKQAADGAYFSADNARPAVQAAKATIGQRAKDVAQALRTHGASAARSAAGHIASHPKSYGAAAAATVGTGVGFAAYKHSKKSEKTAATARLEAYLSDQTGA